jgi:hypothetical protein
MTAIKKLSAKILSAIVPDAKAGACVPENGQCCNAARTRRLNCWGSCYLNHC